MSGDDDFDGIIAELEEMNCQELRDQFAMAALTGALSGRSGAVDIEGAKFWARRSYELADLMLEARKK